MDVYPNPTTGQFTLDLTSEIDEKAIVNVYDNSGKQMFETDVELKVGNQKVHIDLSSLEEGVYSLSIISNEINEQTKLVIVR